MQQNQGRNRYNNFGVMNPIGLNGKSPTSKMVLMKGDSNYKHIIPEDIKSKKVINFDEPSFENNEADYKSRRRVERGDKRGLDKEDEDFLSKKCKFFV